MVKFPLKSYTYLIYCFFLMQLGGGICSCQSTPLESIPFSTVTSSQKPSETKSEKTLTPFQPLPSTQTAISTSTPKPLPDAMAIIKIDGIKTNASYDAGLNSWIWRDKKGNIRRVLDPLSGHVLARTSIGNDRLVYEIDYEFKWEVNLVNYRYYPTHAPLGAAYINLLKLKHPEVFAQANGQTGIIFRILQTAIDELPSSTLPVTLLDEGNEKERFFLKPTYLPASNEYLFIMGLKTDFLTRKGAINTYSEEMLNYCITPNKQRNPSGSWGIEVYKHAIK